MSVDQEETVATATAESYHDAMDAVDALRHGLGRKPDDNGLRRAIAAARLRARLHLMALIRRVASSTAQDVARKMARDEVRRELSRRGL